MRLVLEETWFQKSFMYSIDKKCAIQKNLIEIHGISRPFTVNSTISVLKLLQEDTQILIFGFEQQRKAYWIISVEYQA